MRKEVESISRADRLWMSSMKICSRISGCHQLPGRSFFFGKYQFPLCARCTGIVIGHLLGIVISVFHRVSFFSLLGTIPLMIDGVIQETTSYESNNRRRLCTGILYGFGMMSAFIRAVFSVVGLISNGIILRRKQGHVYTIWYSMTFYSEDFSQENNKSFQKHIEMIDIIKNEIKNNRDV